MKYRAIVSVLMVVVLLGICCLAVADGIVVAFEKREYSVLAGKTETIKPLIQGTKTNGKYLYSSSNESTATVNNNGQIKGIATGDATISCKVTIGADTYDCSYILHVLQPVTQIYVPEKEMTVPLGCYLRELPYQVIPDNASNSKIDILRDGKEQESSSDGTFTIGDIRKGTHKYTFMAADGSNVKATFKVTIPKGAWFSIDSPVIIDDPKGIDFFYVPTLNYGAPILEVKDGSTKGVVKITPSPKSIEDLLSDTPFSYPPNSLTFSMARAVHLEPLKTGKGQYTVASTGDTASLNITVTRSAVYETINYEQFQKSEEKNKSLRFQVSGNISAIEGTCLYVFCDNDELKPVQILVPDPIDISSLVLNNPIIVKGVFTGMNEYITETGLTKLIPCLTAERIEKNI